ncbi:MAG: hypothetical protein E7073_06735 [Bacteroidales bacterium]|jgi:hypothetical protein|nr:hypothetical protein [Bacteroidales bacterium]
MNKTTFYKRLAKAGLTKNNGDIKSGYDWVINELAEGRRARGSYSGRGRFTSYLATDYNRAHEIVKALGLEGEFGNDAARGGKIGEYVALTKKDLTKIDFLANELREAAERRAAEMAAARAEMAAARAEAAAARAEAAEKAEKYAKFCEEGYAAVMARKDEVKAFLNGRHVVSKADCHEIAHQLLHILNNDGVKKAIREIASEIK